LNGMLCNSFCTLLNVFFRFDVKWRIEKCHKNHFTESSS
jgi:hypothetical protein